MGTIQNTAALYLRKSSLDDRAGDNRSITDQRHDLERLAERHGLQIVAEYEEKVGTASNADQAARFSDFCFPLVRPPCDAAQHGPTPGR